MYYNYVCYYCASHTVAADCKSIVACAYDAINVACVTLDECNSMDKAVSSTHACIECGSGAYFNFDTKKCECSDPRALYKESSNTCSCTNNDYNRSGIC